jgi:hypothetical protein
VYGYVDESERCETEWHAPCNEKLVAAGRDNAGLETGDQCVEDLGAK